MNAVRRVMPSLQLVRVQWAPILVATSIAAILSVALLVGTRRAVGALSAHLPAAMLLTTAMLIAVILFCGRFLWRRTLPAAPSAKQIAQTRLAAWTGTLALWLLAAGCSWPMARLADWIVWLPILLIDQVLRQWLIDEVVRQPPRPRLAIHETIESPSRPTNVVTLRVHEARPSASPTDWANTADGEGETPLQQLVRRRTADGREIIDGSLRADFTTGQRTATLHVGFCPPLEILPQVVAGIAEGPDGTVKVVQAFCHGARMEVRLSAAAEEPCSAIVEFAATPSVHTP